MVVLRHADARLHIALRRQRRMRLLEWGKPCQHAGREPLHNRHGVDCQRQRTLVMELRGSNGGTTATCSATKVASAQPVNGACGSSNGGTVSTKPTANLCTAGTASTVAGTGPWSWSCAGSSGGATASCSDTLASTGATGSTGTTGASGSDPTSGVLPSYNDAYANWKNAGLQSVGGIPNRTTVCATISPLGGGKDDTANINNAIASCPAGDVLMLAAGTFTVNEGETINVNKAITLRGTGACNVASTPYCRHRD